MNHIVVLGGGYAGILAATRSVSPQTRVTLIDARPTFTHRIRLHEALAGRSIRSFAYAPMLAKQHIEFVQARVATWEPEHNRVMCRRDDGSEQTITYDVLVNTLGSSVATSVAGVREHALRLDDLHTVAQAAANIQEIANRGGRVLVVGGGLTAIETASELAARYPTLQVEIATNGELGWQYSDHARQYFAQWFQTHNVTINENSRISALDADRAWLVGGGSISFDACVWSAGFAPSPLAREAGMSLHGTGQMRVTSTLQTPLYDNVFGAGDSTAAFRGDQVYRMSCASAMPMGVHAANNIRRLLRGEPLQPFQLDFVAHNISLGRGDGLVHFVHGDDSMTTRIITGRGAALMKETICRAVMGVELTALHTGAVVFGWAKREAQTLNHVQPVDSVH